MVGLEDPQKEPLRAQAMEIRGKPQKIEIRGHTSMRPAGKGTPYRDHWDLAYERCRVTMQFLVQQDIDPRRIRLAVAGANERIHVGMERERLQKNARVEIHVLDELVADLEGSPEQDKAGDQSESEPQDSPQK